jgi:hypothetical protein
MEREQNNHTFVSSFIDLNRLEKRREIKETEVYIKNGLRLLNQPYNFILFVDKQSYETIKLLLSPEQLLRIVLVTIEMSELPICKEVKNEDLKMPLHASPEKDTYNYISLMISKTFFVKKAIEINPFNSVQFSWIDWGILHIIKTEDDLAKFSKALEKVNNTMTNNIRIPGCIHPNIIKNKNILIEQNMHHPLWFFCGGFFSGNIKSLLTFNEDVEICIQMLKDKKIFTWEVNLWASIYTTRYEIFDWYLADHNHTMLSNY